MTLLDQIQTDAAALLAASPAFPPGVVILARMPQDSESDLEASLALNGLAIYVLRPEPLEALYPSPMIFYTKVELRVRVIETPPTNTTGIDVWQARYTVANILHGWHPDKPGMPDPVYTARWPFGPPEIRDTPGRRVSDAVFYFPSHLNP